MRSASPPNRGFVQRQKLRREPHPLPGRSTVQARPAPRFESSAPPSRRKTAIASTARKAQQPPNPRKPPEESSRAIKWRAPSDFAVGFGPIICREILGNCTIASRHRESRTRNQQLADG